MIGSKFDRASGLVQTTHRDRFCFHRVAKLSQRLPFKAEACPDDFLKSP
jgi:hypothetical protein